MNYSSCTVPFCTRIFQSFLKIMKFILIIGKSSITFTALSEFNSLLLCTERKKKIALFSSLLCTYLRYRGLCLPLLRNRVCMSLCECVYNCYYRLCCFCHGSSIETQVKFHLISQILLHIVRKNENRLRIRIGVEITNVNM